MSVKYEIKRSNVWLAVLHDLTCKMYRVNSLSLLLCHSSSNSVSLIKPCCVILFANYQSRPLATLKVKSACYLHSLPIHLLISFFPVICFELLITRPFFDFPRRFQLSGVDCGYFCKVMFQSLYNFGKLTKVWSLNEIWAFHQDKEHSLW